ncbi:Hypothetical_protein [Hexamita inflata]|uniref:Hypothetical_protein n=1 Tax=Hexamita inflata TaxID=28002 RepID=A0AA86Q5L6_9EUKA|nr:Hypothetical protein HINF_LOCUS38606 [Hexamita inflata]
MFQVFNSLRLLRARPIQRCLGLHLLVWLPHPWQPILFLLYYLLIIIKKSLYQIYSGQEQTENGENGNLEEIIENFEELKSGTEYTSLCFENGTRIIFTFQDVYYYSHKLSFILVLRQSIYFVIFWISL